MKIIIAGAGEVGTHLAKLLSREEQDIILIDNDEEKLRELDANYNLMTVIGNPTKYIKPIYLLLSCPSNHVISWHVQWHRN